MPTRRERAQRLQTETQKERQRRIWLRVGAAVAVVIVLALVALSGVLTPAPTATSVGGAPGAATCGPVQSFVSQGQTHIAPNQAHPPYNSNPPTSGWHWDSPQNAGIYGSPQVQEQLVHDLEHGFIVIQYNNLTAAETQRLVDLVQRDRYHMLLAPYPGMPAEARVTLSAWTKLQYCTGVDEKAIASFISAFRDKGPERVP